MNLADAKEPEDMRALINDSNSKLGEEIQDLKLGVNWNVFAHVDLGPGFLVDGTFVIPPAIDPKSMRPYRELCDKGMLVGKKT